MLTQTRSEIDRATLPPILIDFAGYKGGIENRSKLTVEEYLLDLRTFFRYIKQLRGLVPAAHLFPLHVRRKAAEPDRTDCRGAGKGEYQGC